MYMEAKASKKENEAKRGSKDVPCVCNSHKYTSHSWNQREENNRKSPKGARLGSIHQGACASNKA